MRTGPIHTGSAVPLSRIPKLSASSRSGYQRGKGTNPFGTIFSFQIRRQVVDMYDQKGIHLFTAEGIPGFYLAYQDPEVAYPLIFPLAQCLLWQSRGAFVELKEFDETQLRSEAGIATLKLRVIAGMIPKKTINLMERHGAFFGGRGKSTLFFPSKDPGAFVPHIVMYIKDLEDTVR